MNQNNIQGVRQVTPEEIAQVEGVPLTKEELQKTQVLNLKEFAEAVHFEKITSKKPAIIIAVIGALFIIFGSSFQIAKSLSAAKEPEVAPRTAPVQEPQVVENTKKALTCNVNTTGNEDGTDVVYTILFDFDKEKLIGFTKSYSVTATPESANGLATVQKGLEDFRALATKIEGFELGVVETNNGYVATSMADYLKLDLTQFGENLQSNFLSKIDFVLDSDYTQVKQDMESYGFTCN